MFREFKRRFWQPPRAHGEVVKDRAVSFLELFYDLVYVVVIARAAHALAHHPSWEATWQFAIVFGMIWIAWLNGTMYYELHGREDGRTRTFVFLQMVVLALLAVYTEGAAVDTGRQFALIFAGYLALSTTFWWTLRRYDDPQYDRVTRIYLTTMTFSTVVVTASAFVGDEQRLWVWGAFLVVYMLSSLVSSARARTARDMGLAVTESLVERFGLFTIIVLGELVVGVVNGIGESHGGWKPAVTGVVALTIAFAYWWTYFDLTGRRLPREDSGTVLRWILAHLPITGAIAATGAAMVGLVEHAHDDHTPAVLAWLLTGSVALGLMALVPIVTSLADYAQNPRFYRPVTAALATTSLVVLALGWWHPKPLVLVSAVVGVLTLLWLFTVVLWVRVVPVEGETADVVGK